MYRNILMPVALDHEDVLPRKIETGHHLLADGGQITQLSVSEKVPGFVAVFVDMKPENHRMAKVQEKLDRASAGASDITTEVQTGKAGVGISRYAADNDADLAIVGSHRPGVQDYFMGSTESRVSCRAPCSVLIVR